MLIAAIITIIVAGVAVTVTVAVVALAVVALVGTAKLKVVCKYNQQAVLRLCWII